MEITKEKNLITVAGKHFSAEKILKSGQVFRYKPYGGGYFLVAGEHAAILRQVNDTAVIECDDEDYFYNYFDLNTDYNEITRRLNAFPFMQRALIYGEGIRILRQDKLETLISFIISQNNNIARITKIINFICEKLGKTMNFGGIAYNAFPDLKSLAAGGEAFFVKAGAGYRARYLSGTIKKLSQGFDLNSINDMDLASARQTLMGFCGIGRKVCDCILLFGYTKSGVFPVDTWIEKVYNDYIERGAKISRNKMADNFENMFGGLSGYIQQYLFYYKRNKREG